MFYAHALRNIDIYAFHVYYNHRYVYIYMYIYMISISQLVLSHKSLGQEF